MRQECKYFESRTYRNGETVRKCHLDLAPDAPWRCPDECARFERRLADRSWTHGTLVTPPTPQEPASVADGTAAAILDEAEDFINVDRPRRCGPRSTPRWPGRNRARLAPVLRPAVLSPIHRRIRRRARFQSRRGARPRPSVRPERVAAAERAAAMPWPTAAEEIWRYSRIGDLDLERLRARARSTPRSPATTGGSLRSRRPASTRR